MFDGIQQHFGRPYFSIRPVILRSVLDPRPREENSGEVFVFNTNPRIGFVILHHHVIKRLMFLDEIIFQKQRIVFTGNDGGFQPVNFPYHDAGAVSRQIFIEVRKNSFFQIFRFAHIQQLSVFIIITVHSGI